jgi:hypothetical protein
LAHISKFNGQLLTPGLLTIQGDPPDVKLQAAALGVAVEKHRRFVLHCYNGIDVKDAGKNAKLRRSQQELSVIDVNLHTMRLDKCDKSCRDILLSHATRAMLSIEAVLLPEVSKP